MSTNNYQVWEGEMEAAGMDYNSVSIISAVFSAILGILLFFVLISKAVVMGVFGLKMVPKLKSQRVCSETAENLEMSV
jgi:hypothetical protein